MFAHSRAPGNSIWWVPHTSGLRVGPLLLLFPVLHHPTGSIGGCGCPTRRVYVWGFCSCCSPSFITPPDRLAGVGAPHVGFTCGTFDLVVPRPSSPHRIDWRVWVPHTSGLRVGLLLLLFPVLHHPTGSIGGCGCPTRRVYVWGFCSCCSQYFITPPDRLAGVGAPHVGFTCGAFALVAPRPSLPNRIDWRVWVPHTSGLRVGLLLLLFPVLHHPSGSIGGCGCPTRRVYVWGFCSCCSPSFITQPDRLAGVGAPHVGFTCGTFALVVPRPSSPQRIDWRVWVPHTS